MCGILVVMRTVNHATRRDSAPSAKLLEANARRGPDRRGSHRVVGKAVDVRLHVWTLSMQSAESTQPLYSAEDALAYSGEIYDEAWMMGLDDTSALLRRLETSREHALADLEGAQGSEYAFAHWNTTNASLVFGRDFFGTKSLLVSWSGSELILASCAVPGDGRAWSEVDVSSFYRASLSSDKQRIVLESMPRLVSIQTLSEPPLVPFSTFEEAVAALNRALLEAVRRRVANRCILNDPNSLCVYFSGGVDSVAIALMVDEAVEDKSAEIHLVNVSFSGESSPDRIAAKEALAEMRSVTKRAFRLTCVDVTATQAVHHESDILTLIHPNSTAMDFNLGAIFYFGALKSPAQVRVVLTGSGADELLGGYKRHARSADHLKTETSIDLNRLWKRNCGRDDRCVAAHGKELRIPFLDHDVVRACLHAMRTGIETGKKSLLREVVRLRGCVKSADREKKAAQFGSRAAKSLGQSSRAGGGAQLYVPRGQSHLATDEDPAL